MLSRIAGVQLLKQHERAKREEGGGMCVEVERQDRGYTVVQRDGAGKNDIR